jgi:cation transport ATPase
MQFEYSLNENDYLQHQLFIASKSNRIKRKRIKSWIIVSVATLLLFLFFYQQHNKFMMYCTLALAIYTILFYPTYLKSHYKNHYKKFIADTYKNRIGVKTIIKFDENCIIFFDRTGEGKINLSEIDIIYETGAYIYLRMKIGETLIIPKIEMKNVQVSVTQFNNLANRLNVKFIEELNWKWR